MQEVLRKIKKVQPLIKARKAQLDRESAELAKIRSAKIEVVRAMKDSQRRYMDGVRQLNDVRTSTARQNLPTLESGLDMVRTNWEQLFREVRTMEGKEKAQMSLVLKAHTELRSVELLKEKYETELVDAQRRAEQKEHDEFGLRKFTYK